MLSKIGFDVFLQEGLKYVLPTSHITKNSTEFNSNGPRPSCPTFNKLHPAILFSSYSPRLAPFMAMALHPTIVWEDKTKMLNERYKYANNKDLFT